MQKQTAGGEQSIQGRWSEVVCDSWRSRLTNVHQEHDLGGDGMFTFDPATGLYGFQVGHMEDELATDIMNEPEHTESVEDQEVAESDDDDYKEGSSNGEESPDSKPKPRPNISHTYDLDQVSDNENEEINDSVFEEGKIIEVIVVHLLILGARATRVKEISQISCHVSLQEHLGVCLDSSL